MYNELYREWCNGDYFDKATRDELKNIAGNDEEIRDRFYKKLEFGTGGLRGIIGAGINRMNIYTVRQATQGLANYIISQHGMDKGVVIAYDSRVMSPEFSKEAALCLNANGIKTYRFDSLRPTPELSFAVRKLGCIAGIVITASHNPKEYNGYKVYWEDGAQITSPHDKNIMKCISEVNSWGQVKTMAEPDAVKEGLYNTAGTEIDDAYIAEIKKQSIHPEVISQAADSIKIVYTPLHGTGNMPVRRIFKEAGFNNVYIVKEQEMPDGTFPAVASPNPEDERAWELALKLAKETDADIILATDPDADRLGVYVKNTVTGEYISFTGNMSGVLIAEYILRERTANGTLPENPALVETIVTTDMAKEVAAAYNTKLIEVLTGFKYIGGQIKLFEENNSYNYVFGFEESYGCLAGTYARDKDACAAVMLLCEAAAFYKMQDKTLWDAMTEMYAKYGYYKEGLTTLVLKGEKGAEEIKNIMEKMRSEMPDAIGGYKVEAMRDYLEGTRKIADGREERLSLPKSNVIYFELSGGAWCCVRPSGTEPKIKYYYGVKGSSLEDAGTKLKSLKKALMGC